MDPSLTKMEKYLVEIEKIPDIRGKRVAEISSKINKGIYRADSKKIALKMIEQSMDELFF